MNDHTKREIKSWTKSICIALGVAFVVRTFIFAPYIVEGASMEPTLHNKEKIFVNKFTLTDNFKRGEVVIIKGEEENYVKRIIGIPGDSIEMKQDQLLINGVHFKESYLSQNRKLAEQMGSLLTGDFGPEIVPKNYYFVMGDNRLHSMDSRNGLGYIQKESIVGKPEFVFLPFTQIRNIK
jgi:signal peptidase I